MKRILGTILGCLLLSWPLAASSTDGAGFTIHLCGDSTMAEKDLKGGTNPERGWGMMFPNFVQGAKVINYAQNGRSTKSFIDQGYWDKVMANLQEGDWVFIEFGHNDSKESDPARYCAAFGAYQDNLRRFISDCRSKGANPVLLTPLARRLFKDGKAIRNNHGDYPEAVKQVAAEQGVPLLDMTTASLEWLDSLGPEESKKYYMTSSGKPSDNTHTNIAGAKAITGLVCAEIKRVAESGEGLNGASLDALKAVLIDGSRGMVVSADGHGDFLSIQEAIDAAPDFSHGEWTVIRVREGIYNECVSIPANKRMLRICGDGAGSTIIRGGKFARQIWPAAGFEVGTSGSATMFICADDIILEDISVENTAGEGKGIDQAVALLTNGDRILLRRCRFIGNQDTVYTYGRWAEDGGIMRVCFLDCHIEGTTDFIFGPSIAWFQGCTIHSKKNSYVTAASTLKGQSYGYVFKDCRLTAAEGIGKCYLGRPWGAYAKTVFIGCELRSHILPEGWHDWEKPGKPDSKKNSFYAEYGNSGPGAAGKKERVKWSRQLSGKQAAAYTLERVFSREALTDRDGKNKPFAKDWNPLEVK